MLASTLPTNRLVAIANFDPGSTSSAALVTQVHRLGARTLSFRHLDSVGVYGTPAQVLQVAGLRGVTGLYANTRLTDCLHESVPAIGADDAWAMGLPERGIGVAILDSGVDATHPDLAMGSKTVQNVKVASARRTPSPWIPRRAGRCSSRACRIPTRAPGTGRTSQALPRAMARRALATKVVTTGGPLADVLGGRVARAHKTGVVDGDDAFGDVVEHRAQMRFTLAERGLRGGALGHLARKLPIESLQDVDGALALARKHEQGDAQDEQWHGEHRGAEQTKLAVIGRQEDPGQAGRIMGTDQDESRTNVTIDCRVCKQIIRPTTPTLTCRRPGPSPGQPGLARSRRFEVAAPGRSTRRCPRPAAGWPG